MWTYIFFALFLGTLLALLLVLNAFTRRIIEIEKRRAEIQVEEDRVFDFMHGLGEAFSEGVRSADLHRLIVESATRILDAHGGVLYLADPAESQLMPAYVSKGCPPLIEVPANILAQSETVPLALDSYLRLQILRRGQGVVGRIWQEGRVRVLGEAEIANLTGLRDGGAHSAIGGPLVYRRKVLGVLALANGPVSTPFSEKDINVYRAILEQSAFALYNEAVYLEASEKKRLDHDLAIAREIQSILLPSTAPEFPGYEIAGVNIPARQVSGDYYDYIQVDEHRMGVVIADVSGKGVPASLIMAMCRSVPAKRGPRKDLPDRGSPANQLPALSRHQGRHVHQHGLHHPGCLVGHGHARPGGPRCAAPLSRRRRRCREAHAEGNGAGH